MRLPPTGLLTRERARFALATAGSVFVLAILVQAVSLRLHQEGHAQEVTAYLNGADRLLRLPGACLARLARVPRVSIGGLSLRWLVAVVVNVPIYFVAALLVQAFWGRRTRRAEKPLPRASRTAAVGDMTRRGFLGRGLQGVGGGLLAGAGYAVLVEPRWFDVTRQVVRLGGLPAGLNGLRIVQLTDLHHGHYVSAERIAEVVDLTNELRPDLVLLTGDFVDHTTAYIPAVARELARLRPRVGSLAVLGNHDWYVGAKPLRQQLRRAGIRVIDNDRRVLTPGRKLVRRAGEGLAIAGVGDLWEDQPDYQKALGGLPRKMPRLLLSHNPDVAEEPELLHGGWRVDLMLSGHTHGGQVSLPLIGPPLTASAYGKKYAAGLVRGPVCPVYVNRGLGMSTLPVRFGARPEVAFFELQTEAPPEMKG